MKDLDERNRAILAGNVELWEARPGPRVGDFVILPDGGVRRFTQDMGTGLQITSPDDPIGQFRFYIRSGWMTYTGDKDSAILKGRLTLTDEKRNGHAWFFHHNVFNATKSVHIVMPCRVFRYTPNSVETET